MSRSRFPGSTVSIPRERGGGPQRGSSEQAGRSVGVSIPRERGGGPQPDGLHRTRAILAVSIPRERGGGPQQPNLKKFDEPLWSQSPVSGEGVRSKLKYEEIKKRYEAMSQSPVSGEGVRSRGRDRGPRGLGHVSIPRERGGGPQQAELQRRRDAAKEESQSPVSGEGVRSVIGFLTGFSDGVKSQSPVSGEGVRSGARVQGEWVPVQVSIPRERGGGPQPPRATG